MAATSICTSVSCSNLAAELSSSRGAVNGAPVVSFSVKSAVSTRNGLVRCSNEAQTNVVEVSSSNVSRRLAIALLAGAAAVTTGRVSPAEAAYGEAANVFGAPRVDTGFVTYKGEGFSLNVPAKWNPSKEVEFPGQVLRYEDNFDATNNLSVSILKSEKGSITDYGSPEKLLTSLSYLLGKQSYAGKTDSEGGFAENAVSTAALLDSEVKEANGKTYYALNVLTRTADGDEGGKHQLIIATIDGGKLFILKAQAGDKRWFKGAKKFIEGVINSFNVV
ncbi:unnamed protein product [Calypogeia fissa]